MFPLRRRNTDTVPAMLTPGEVILNKQQQQGVGVTDPSKLLPQQLAKLHIMQRAQGTQPVVPQMPVRGYRMGGVAAPTVTRFPAMRAARIPITPPQHLPKAPNLGAMLPIDFAHQRELARGVGAPPKPPVRGPAQYGGSPQYYAGGGVAGGWGGGGFGGGGFSPYGGESSGLGGDWNFGGGFSPSMGSGSSPAMPSPFTAGVASGGSPGLQPMGAPEASATPATGGNQNLFWAMKQATNQPNNQLYAAANYGNGPGGRKAAMASLQGWSGGGGGGSLGGGGGWQ